MTKKSNSDQAATKADIARLEESIKNSATKDDLKKFATKDDLKNFATKTELKKTERVLRAEILRVEEKVENVEDGLRRVEKKLTDKIDGIEVKLDRISNQLDGFVGRVDNLTVDNHEERITRLEPT